MVSGAFSGRISIKESSSKRYVHKPTIIDNTVDPRIDVLKEYISKTPDATLKDLKSALKHFTKATDSEFLNLVKSANIQKYNELTNFITQNISSAQIISSDFIRSGSKYREDELNFIIQHINNNRSAIYTLYKTSFPNSQRKSRFIRDCQHLMKIRPVKYVPEKMCLPERIPPQKPSKMTIQQTFTNHQLVTKTIRSLYKAGYTPETLPKIKPVINELLGQNSNYDEIELAIEYLKP